MSVLNLGLQCVGLARDLMPDDFEKEVGKCNNLTELRKIASHKSGIKLAVQDSLSPVKVLSLYIGLLHQLLQMNCMIFGLLLLQSMQLYRKEEDIVRII